METTDFVQLGEFCARLHLADREARYVLERGFVPAGVAKSPCTGNRRQFDPLQLLWLAIVVKLRQCGIKTSQAAEIAHFGINALKAERDRGQIKADQKCYLDVADQQYGRLRTVAARSDRGAQPVPWCAIRGDRKVPVDFQPIVVLQIDLSEIARLLRANPSTAGR